jgi:uncharacterized surface anchored protein
MFECSFPNGDMPMASVFAFSDNLLMPLTASKSIPLNIYTMSITHNGVNINPGSSIEFKSGDRIIMNFNWEVNYSGVDIDILNGDTASVQLWEPGFLPITLNSPVTAALTLDDDEVVGTMTLNPTGGLNIVFNDKLEGQFGVRGTISVETFIDYGKVDSLTEDIEFFGETFKFTFKFQRISGGGRSIAKNLRSPNFHGTPGNINRILWGINVNTLLSPDTGIFTVADTLSAANSEYNSHEIIPSSVKIFELDIDPSNTSQDDGWKRGNDVTAAFIPDR